MSDDSVLGTLRKAPGFVAKTVERLVVTRRLDRRIRDDPDHPATNREAAFDAIQDADRILFLCWGNVCRSPLAARYLRSRLEGVGVDGVTVESAGVGEREGRPSPETAVAAAADHGVDLTDHRSERVSADQVGGSDAIFVMDHYNYYLLVTRYPSAADRTFFLGAVTGDRDPVTISDPYGEDRASFEDVYGTIVAAIDRLVESLPPANQQG